MTNPFDRLNFGLNDTALSALQRAAKQGSQYDDLIKATSRHHDLFRQAQLLSPELELVRRFLVSEDVLASVASISKTYEDVFPSTALLETTAARQLGVSRLLEEAYLPTAEQFGLLPEIMKQQQSYLADLATQNGLQSVIAQMQTIHDPWMLGQAPATSLLGFAELTAFHHTVSSPDPMRRDVQNLVDETLGDVIHFDLETDEDEMDIEAIEAGADETLIAFPKAQYGAVLIAAGFDFKFAMPKPPQPIEGPKNIQPYDSADHQVVYALERHCRDIVTAKLQSIVGTKWFKQRVPSDVRDNCKERQETARQKGEPIFALIEYADFSDLQKIICRGDNWKEVFSTIFLHREQTQLSLERLKPVRDAISHSRGLGSVAKLTLASEAARLFTVLGVAH